MTSYKTDAKGNTVKLTGIEAIQNKKEQERAIAGLITEEKVAKAVKDFRECYQEYGSAFPPEVPMEVYNEKIAPQYPVLEQAAGACRFSGVRGYHDGRGYFSRRCHRVL